MVVISIIAVKGNDSQKVQAKEQPSTVEATESTTTQEIQSTESTTNVEPESNTETPTDIEEPTVIEAPVENTDNSNNYSEPTQTYTEPEPIYQEPAQTYTEPDDNSNTTDNSWKDSLSGIPGLTIDGEGDKKASDGTLLGDPNHHDTFIWN